MTNSDNGSILAEALISGGQPNSMAGRPSALFPTDADRGLWFLS